MAGPSVVIDTNVIVSGLRSRRGAAYRLLPLVGTGKFELCLSVPLVLEYEAALKRLVGAMDVSVEEIDEFLDYLVAAASHHRVFFLWRPFLKDPGDEMVLELAVSAACDCIVTYNKRDFAQAPQRFGIQVMDAREFLMEIGE
jgi:putative PIN family toxin of toxin-antitoxin system